MILVSILIQVFLYSTVALMAYEDNHKKFVAILNKKIPLPKLMNALGHITIGLTDLVPKQDFELMDYKDADGGSHPAISRFPFIVLSCKNSNQLRSLRQKLLSQGLPCNDFTDQMVQGSAQEQIARMSDTREEDLEYYGVVTFGDAEELRPLTKKFSLRKKK